MSSRSRSSRRWWPSSRSSTGASNPRWRTLLCCATPWATAALCVPSWCGRPTRPTRAAPRCPRARTRSAECPSGFWRTCWKLSSSPRAASPRHSWWGRWMRSSRRWCFSWGARCTSATRTCAQSVQRCSPSSCPTRSIARTQHGRSTSTSTTSRPCSRGTPWPWSSWYPTCCGCMSTSSSRGRTINSTRSMAPGTRSGRWLSTCGRSPSTGRCGASLRSRPRRRSTSSSSTCWSTTASSTWMSR
mmetsp:Transcript_48214/g.154415  ORF Transcript_48214/g.154415 Transcript_48214/m.154415 type:complete len:244 (+) Transcript_48214:256-987(+)